MSSSVVLDNSFSENICYGSNDLNSNLKESLFNNLIWGIDDVCKFTSYAKGTIYNLVSRGEIPYRTRGRKKRLVLIPESISKKKNRNHSSSFLTINSMTVLTTSIGGTYA